MKLYFPELKLSRDEAMEWWTSVDSPGVSQTESSLAEDSRMQAIREAMESVARTKFRYARTETNKLKRHYNDAITQTEEMEQIRMDYADLSRWKFVYLLREAQWSANKQSNTAANQHKEVLLYEHKLMLMNLDLKAYHMIFGEELATEAPHSSPPEKAWLSDRQHVAIERIYRHAMAHNYVFPLIIFLEEQLLIPLLISNIIPADLYILNLAISSKWYKVIKLVDTHKTERLYVRFIGMDEPSMLDDFIDSLDGLFREKWEQLQTQTDDATLTHIRTKLNDLLDLHHNFIAHGRKTGVTIFGDPLSEKHLGDMKGLSARAIADLLDELRHFLTVQESEALTIKTYLMQDSIGNNKLISPPKPAMDSHHPQEDSAYHLIISQKMDLLMRMTGLMKNYTNIFKSMKPSDMINVLSHVLRKKDGTAYQLDTIRPFFGKMDVVLLDKLIKLLETLVTGAKYEIQGDTSHRLNEDEEES